MTSSRVSSAIALYQSRILSATKQVITAQVSDPQSAEYAGCTLKLDGTSCTFRQGKITPTKVGYFATMYRRQTSEKIIPLTPSEMGSFMIVMCGGGEGKECGQFIFPASLLLEKGILRKSSKLSSSDGSHTGGKLAFRVYPPWVTASSGQAIKTQMWQVKHFVSERDPSAALEVFKGSRSFSRSSSPTTKPPTPSKVGAKRGKSEAEAVGAEEEESPKKKRRVDEEGMKS